MKYLVPVAFMLVMLFIQGCAGFGTRDIAEQIVKPVRGYCANLDLLEREFIYERLWELLEPDDIFLAVVCPGDMEE